MTVDMIMGLLRQVLPIAGTVLMALGILDKGTDVVGVSNAVLTALGGLINAMSVVWAAVANSKSSIIASAAQMPEVEKMTIADPTLAKVAKDAAPETRVDVPGVGQIG